MATQVIDMCSDPYCGEIACYTMISRVRGHRTKLCRKHREQVLAALAKAVAAGDLKAEDERKLDIKAIRGNCGECLMRDVEVVALQSDGVCPKCGADYGPAETGVTYGQ